MKKWFETWFDSKYYHILYQHRDETEANTFINALVASLHIPKNAKVLDLACGAGRHSNQLAKHGFDVTGVDLSSNSIEEAKKNYSKENLHFDVADMRTYSAPNNYDFIFNLFTSFGYFDSLDDNLKVLKHVYRNCKENGTFVIDFMNARKVAITLTPSESILLDGIEFNITRHCDGEHIIKTIDFSDEGKNYSFHEKVQYIEKDTLVELIEKSGFEIVNIYGNHKLLPFNEDQSHRCIIVAKKN